MSNEKLKNIGIGLLLVWALGITSYLVIKGSNPPPVTTIGTDSAQNQPQNKNRGTGDAVDPYEKKPSKKHFG